MTEASSSGVVGNENVDIVIPDVAEFWECRQNSSQKDMVLFPRLCHPACGALSKSKVLMWKAIEDKVLHEMSEASFVPKIEVHHDDDLLTLH
jgi:hypothetical protein